MNLPKQDEIYFPKTREYFKEVLSSYSNRNYRSATVMLYSVAICDILFKLQEISDMYNDSVAKEILEKVSEEQKRSERKSSWEKTLLDEVKDRTHLLDIKAYLDLSHLFDDRNLSAHPAMNQNFELIAPSQETTIAHINNVLNGILVKPPIFIKSIVDMLTEDLKEKRGIYIVDGVFNHYDLFDEYLKNKYFSRMAKPMLISTFKALWKLCFKISDDENCKNNRRINRSALEVLIGIALEDIEGEIKGNKLYYTVAHDDSCEFHLVALLSKYPLLYRFLDEAVQLQIKQIVDRISDAKWYAWFLFKDLNEHAQFLMQCGYPNTTINNIAYAYNYYCTFGSENLLLDVFVKYYIESRSYADADLLYQNLIDPYLDKFTERQLIDLLVGTNGNNQIYNNFNTSSRNIGIVSRLETKYGKTLDYSKYQNFKFYRPITEPKENKNAD